MARFPIIRRLMKQFPTFFSRQARKPSGLFGRWVMGRGFAKGNLEMNSFVFQTMSLAPDSHVLEVGSGTGTLMAMVAERLEGGSVEGVDFSSVMHKLCCKRNRDAIARGRAKAHLGDFDAMEWPEQGFDAAFTVNTVYFWKQPKATAAKLHALLKPGGRLYVGFHDREVMERSPLDRDVFTYYSPDSIRAMLTADNLFQSVSIHTRFGGEQPCHCAIAFK